MKKFISILLVTCIVFGGIMPHTVYANDGDGESVAFVQKDPGTYWSNQDVTITLTDEDASYILYQSKKESDDDFSDWANYESPIEFKDDGSYIINAESQNNDFDVLEQQYGVLVHIDKISPTLLVEVDDSEWTRDNREISFEATDDFSEVSHICLSDGTIVASIDDNDEDGKFTASYDVSENGDYAFYSVDHAGNKSVSLTRSVVRIDKNSPANAPSFVNAPENSEWQRGPVNITLNWTDERPDDESPEEPQYSKDNINWYDYVQDSSIEITSEGVNKVYVRTRDYAGNKSDINQATVNIDNTIPILEAVGNDGSWTNNAVTITLNAFDVISSVTGIYNKSTGTAVTESSSLELTFTANIPSTLTYYTQDQAGNKSADCEININNIDTEPPSAPTIIDYNSDWTSNDVIIQISKVDAPENQSPEKRQYSTDGGETWVDIEAYGDVQGDSFSVSKEGQYDVLVRTVDQAGNESSNEKASVKIDKADPVIANVNYEPDEANPGKGTVTVDISDSSSGIYEQKYSIGQQTLDYFEENNGIVIDGSSFIIDGADGGQYTIYAKDYAGNVALVDVHEVVDEINTYPMIGSVENQVIDEDADEQILVIDGIQDNETTVSADLEISIDVENTDSTGILENISIVNNGDNTATLKYTPKENAHGETSITINVTDEGITIDGESGQNKRTTSRVINITVESVNDAPVAADDEIDANEGDENIDIYALGNDDDVEGDVLINTFDSVSQQGGTVIKNTAGDGFVYNPSNPNFSGVDTFEYTIKDEEGKTDAVLSKATVTINVQNELDVPIAVDDNHTLDEDQTVYIDVLNNDDDYDLGYVDNEKLVISVIEADGDVVEFDDRDEEVPVDEDLFADVGYGIVKYDKDGEGKTRLKFIPKENYHGEFSFDYIITDVDNQTSQATVDITVISVNDAPVISGLREDLTYNYDEDTGNHQIVFSISDVEIEQASGLSIRAVSQHQSILSNAEMELLDLDDNDEDGGETILEIRPREDVYGYVEIDLELSDGNEITHKILKINIANINDPPEADSFKIYYTEDTEITFDLDDYNENYSDIDNDLSDLVPSIEEATRNDILTATNCELIVVDAAQHTYKFIPHDDYDENIVVNYTLSDGSEDTTVGQFTLIARPSNDGPLIEEYETNDYETNEDVPKGALPTDADFDTYIEEDLLIFTISDVDNSLSELNITFESSNEKLVLPKDITYERDGDKIYAKITPNLNQPEELKTDGTEQGTSLITVTVSDGKAQDSISFEFVVNPIQDDPVAVNDETHIEYNGFGNIFPLENDYDVDVNDTLTIISVQPENDKGDVTISDDGLSLVYVAKTNFKGEDIVTYTISDDKGNTAVGEIKVIVGDDNVPPEIDNILDVWAYEDASPYTTVDFNVIDPDVDDFETDITFTYHSSNPALISTDGITREINANGEVVLTLKPEAEHLYGESTITVTVSDGDGTDADTFLYKVYPVNDEPDTEDDYYTIDEDAQTDDDSNIIAPIDNDSDVDNLDSELSLISITGNKNGYLEFLGNNRYRYYPDEDFNDTQLPEDETYAEILTYIVSDGNKQSEGKIYINVTSVNDAPIARNDDRVLATIGGEINFDPKSNDSDVDDTVLTITKIGTTAISAGDTVATSHGQVYMNADGTLTYTRTSEGEDSFYYTIADDDDAEGTARIRILMSSTDGIWINWVNDRTIYEECEPPETIEITYHVPDNIGDYTVSIDQPESKKGIAVIESDVSNKITISYTPSLDKNGDDSFTVTVSDDSGDYAQKSRLVNIDILPVNDDPVFIDWDETDNDPENSTVVTTNTVTDPITSITMTEDTTSGWYTVLFQDNKDWENDNIDGLNNEDLSFELVIGDSGDDEPILLEDNVEVVRSDDDDNYSAVDFRFTPISERFGTIPITIKVSDGIATTESTFNLIVEGENDPPVAPDFYEIISEDTRFTEILVTTASDLEDKDNVDIAVPAIASGTDNGLGTVELLEDNKTIVYTPNHDAVGIDEFTYTITDKTGDERKSATGTVTVQINEVNDNPTVEDYQYSYTVLEDNSIEIIFVAKDVDVGDTGEVLHFEITGIKDLDGVASDISDLQDIGDDLIDKIDTSETVDVGNTQSTMKMIVKPEDNQSGSRIIKLTVKDDNEPEAGQTELEFVVNFDPANDAPIAVNDPTADDEYIETDEDTSVDIYVLSNDSDIDEDSVLHVTEVNTTIDENFKGSLTIDSVNDFITYTPPDNYHCEEGQFIKFQYTVSDQFGGTDTAEVRIKVISVNDNPKAEDDEAETDEDIPVTIDVLIQGKADSDVDGDTLSIVTEENNAPAAWHTGGDKAKSIEVVDNKIVYTPADDEYGVDTFEYKITDGNGGYATAEVEVTIYSIIDDPDLTSDENNPTVFVMFEDEIKDYNIHYYNVEDVYKDIIFTTESSDEAILKNTGITTQKINVDDATVHDVWIKMSFEPVSNMNTGNPGDGNIDVTVTKKIGSEVFKDILPMYILPVNDSPTITSIDDDLETDEQAPIVGNVVGKDQETLTDELRYFTANSDDVVVSSIDPYSGMYMTKTPNGTVVINTATGDYTYTPDEDFVGEDSFYVYVDDNFRETGNYTVNGVEYERQDEGATAFKLVTVNVENVNDPPVAVDDADTTDEDTPVSIQVKLNDSDVDDDIADVDIVQLSEPSNGSVAVSGGEIVYTPDANFNGTDTFTYKLDDKNEQNNISNTATVTITITSVDDSPIALDDNKTIDEDSGYIEIEVLHNDENPDRSDLSDPKYTELTILGFEDENGEYILEGKVANGLVKIEDNKLYYKPDLNSVAGDTFDYKISDGDGDTTTAQVDITITTINDPPVAGDDSATTGEEIPVEIEVKVNDSDVEDSDKQDLAITIIDGPANGTAEILDSGEIKYTPILNFVGEDTFTYKITDSDGATSNLATVTITVEARNDVPEAHDDTQSVPEDTTDFAIDVLNNDINPDRSDLSDPEYTGLTIVGFENTDGDIVTEGKVEHGYIKVVDNKLLYTPDPDFEGEENFSYKIEDEDGDSDIADVTLTITPGEEIPVVTIPDTFSGIYEDQPLAFEVDLGEYVYDQDDGDNWDVIFESNASFGIADFDQSTKILTYSPNVNYNGMDSITIQVDDGVNKVPATINFEVIPVNDAPVAEDDSAVGLEDTIVTIDVIVNDHDVDNDPLLNKHETCVADVLTIVEDGFAGVEHGEVTIDGNNIVFTPDENWSGEEKFTYTVKDSAGLTSTAQVTITLTAVDDTVIVNPNTTQELLEDEEINDIDVGSLIMSDPDGDPEGEARGFSFEFAFDRNDNFTKVSEFVYSCKFGTYTISGDGEKISFIPIDDFNGVVTFPILVTMDEGGAPKEINVPIYVEAVNDEAIPKNDRRQTEINTPVNVSILVNDIDVDTNELINAEPFVFDVRLLTQPSHGTAEIINASASASLAPTSAGQGIYKGLKSNNISLASTFDSFETYCIPLAGNNLNSIKVRYTPNYGFYGIDTFYYAFDDGDGTQKEAKVTIEIFNSHTSTDGNEENPKTGYFIPKRIAEFLGLN